jgi:hypothetical protein
MLLVAVSVLIGVLAAMAGPANADVPKKAGCQGISNAIEEGYENFSITTHLLKVGDVHACS